MIRRILTVILILLTFLAAAIAIKKYAIPYFDKSDEVLNALSNAKSLMFQNKLISDYKKAYKDYQILVGNITDVVFKDFKKDSLLDKIIRAK